MISCQPQIRRRSGKVCQPKTDILTIEPRPVAPVKWLLSLLDTLIAFVTYLSGDAANNVIVGWHLPQSMCTCRRPRVTRVVPASNPADSVPGRTSRQEWANGHWWSVVSVSRWSRPSCQSTGACQHCHTYYQGTYWNWPQQLYSVVWSFSAYVFHLFIMVISASRWLLIHEGPLICFHF